MASFDAVPDDAVRAILSHLGADDLWELRGCSRTLRRLAEQAPQWLPIIAPPSLSHTTLTLAAHGTALRALYARYRRWQHAWVRLRNKDDEDEPDEEALRAQSTALDGFFGLDPWHRLDADGALGTVCAPLPWLQLMVYAAEAVAEAPPAGGRRSRRLQPKPPDELPSRFYQQRDRDEDEELRAFWTKPVFTSRAARRREPNVRRYIVQPANLHRLVPAGIGTQPEPYFVFADPRLPYLSNVALQALELTKELLECYLPADSIEIAQVKDAGITSAKLHQTHMRIDRQGAVNDAGQPVYQIGSSALADTAEHDSLTLTADAFTTFVIAPHMYASGDEQLDWVFSCPIVKFGVQYDGWYERWLPEGATEDHPDSWVVSTHQVEAWLSHSETLRRRVIAINIAYCVLGKGVGIEPCCENSPCIMNNSDGVGESASRSLLLCPCCLRKLQLMGILTDVPACLDKLSTLLNGDALREVSVRDREILRCWGQ